MSSSRVRPVLAQHYNKPGELLTLADLQSLVPDCLPAWASKVNAGHWVWTTEAGVWRLYLSMSSDTSVPEWTVRLENSPVRASVGATRREIDAVLRFMVAVGAIEAHLDAPRAAKPAVES